MPSALDLLLLKLASEDYDIVRTTMSGVTRGAFAGFMFAKPLTRASIDVLVAAGTSAADLRAAGYPDQIVALFEQALHDKLAKR